MNVDSLVKFHKTVGDSTRIRILTLLASGPLHGQALATKLGVTAPTITHHMDKLRSAGLIYERREKNTIYFHLNEEQIKSNALAILEAVFQNKGTVHQPAGEAPVKSAEAEVAAVMQSYFLADGRLKKIPAQRKKKLIIIEHIIKGLKQGRVYPEQELDEYIKRFHEDCATIRREMILNHFMFRENGRYQVNPSHLWANNKKP